MRELMDDGGTGDAQVDEAVRTLDTLDGLPVHEHAAVVERVHQVLQDRLTGEPDDHSDGDDFDDAHDHGEPAAPAAPAGGAARPGPSHQARPGDGQGGAPAGPAGGAVRPGPGPGQGVRPGVRPGDWVRPGDARPGSGSDGGEG